MPEVYISRQCKIASLFWKRDNPRLDKDDEEKRNCDADILIISIFALIKIPSKENKFKISQLIIPSWKIYT